MDTSRLYLHIEDGVVLYYQTGHKGGPEGEVSTETSPVITVT